MPIKEEGHDGGQVHSENDEKKAKKNLNAEVESVLKYQLIISTFFLLFGLYAATALSLSLTNG
jgi:hypothetical protein